MNLEPSKYVFFNVGTFSGVHLFDHLLWSIYGGQKDALPPPPDCLAETPTQLTSNFNHNNLKLNSTLCQQKKLTDLIISKI